MTTRLATVVSAVLVAALVAAAAVDRLVGNGAAVEQAPMRPLVSTQLIPAGTSGEDIVRRQLVSEWKPSVMVSVPAPYIVYDPAYLRGRVAIVDIPSGRFLGKRDFRP